MRLIDADALKQRVGSYNPVKYTCEYGDVITVDDIDSAPTVDAVLVVRCKDCKHRDPEDKKCDCGHDIQWQLPRDAEWFCADGERREDG